MIHVLLLLIIGVLMGFFVIKSLKEIGMLQLLIEGEEVKEEA